jgi:hypothetical protein
MKAASVILVAAALVLAACASPEATRMRGGGPGADPANRAAVVLMHEGSLPYHETPRLIEPYGHPELAAARQAHRLSVRSRKDPR